MNFGQAIASGYSNFVTDSYGGKLAPPVAIRIVEEWADGRAQRVILAGDGPEPEKLALSDHKLVPIGYTFDELVDLCKASNLVAFARRPTFEGFGEGRSVLIQCGRRLRTVRQVPGPNDAASTGTYFWEEFEQLEKGRWTVEDFESNDWTIYPAHLLEMHLFDAAVLRKQIKLLV